MTEFTKGTWIHNLDTAIVSAHTLTANGKDIERPVAAVFGAATSNIIGDTTEPFANARLIENAPAMFELLEKLELVCDCGFRDMINTPLSKIRSGTQTVDEPRKPCPFCGCVHSTIIHVVPEKQYCVECSRCECSTRLCDTKDEAVDAWNTRERTDTHDE